MQDYPKQVRVVGSVPAFAAVQPTQEVPLLRFFIRLPYHLPIPSGQTFRMSRSADPNQPAWVVVSMRQFNISLADSALDPYRAGLKILRGEAAPQESGGKSTQSWVVADTLDVAFDDEPEAKKLNQVLTRAFERCLAAINLLSESSRLATGEIWSYPIAKDSLDSEVKCHVLDPRSGAVLAENSLRINHRKINTVTLPHNEREVSERIRQAVARRLESEAASAPHPFVTSRSLALEAQTQRVHGAASASIVSLQASVESLLRGLCTMLHRDLGTQQELVAAKAEIPFESLIKRELPGLLGGRWSGLDSVPGEYEVKLYKLRNRIVHAGYAPSYLEVNPAFDVRDRLTEFIERQLKERWRKYPTTTLAWHDPLAGGPGRTPRAAKNTLDEIRKSRPFYWA